MNFGKPGKYFEKTSGNPVHALFKHNFRQKNLFYKYMNKIKLIYHKLIKLKYLIAFILQYKAIISNYINAIIYIDILK